MKMSNFGALIVERKQSISDILITMVEFVKNVATIFIQDGYFHKKPDIRFYESVLRKRGQDTFYWLNFENRS